MNLCQKFSQCNEEYISKGIWIFFDNFKIYLNKNFPREDMKKMGNPYILFAIFKIKLYFAVLICLNAYLIFAISNIKLKLNFVCNVV